MTDSLTFNGNGFLSHPSLVHAPSSGPSDETRTALWARFQELREFESKKDQLIEEILVRYDTLSNQHRIECADLDRERDYSRNAQIELKLLRAELAKRTHHMTRDPFVVVLLDGDGMIFQDQLLREGETGGRRAATLLHNAVLQHVQDVHPELGNVKVVARLYANFKGLSETLCRSGIVDRTSTVDDFFRGFTRGKALFDCIDVGAGKDRADEKLSENFKLYVYNQQCQSVILGCSHDNGYVRLLDEIMMETETIKRVTLLAGVPFEREYTNVPFQKTKFPNLFRDTKLNIYAPGAKPLSPQPIHDYNQLPAPFPPPGLLSRTSSASPSLPTRTASVSSTDSHPAPPSSWAAAAKSLTKQPTPVNLSQPKVNAAPAINRNRLGQRVDPVTRPYDKEEVQRVKKLKMCNVHFLRQECPYGNECTHDHRYKPTQGELQTLKLVARMAPCQNGSGCDDVKCIYGHICPAPEAKDGRGKGGKNCIFGENCRFSVEMHNVDRNIVRFTKVT